MAKRLIGTGVTDANGLATINYTGKGVGEMDIVAEILGYYLFRDGGVTGDSNATGFIYNSTYVSLSTSSSGTTVSNSDSSTKGIYLNASPNGNEYDFNGNVVVEFDLVSVDDGTYIACADMNGNTVAHYNALNSCGGKHIKMVNDGSTSILYVNGEQVSSKTYNLNGLYHIRFTIQGSSSFKYKNLVVYEKDTAMTSTSFTATDCLFYDTGVTGTAVNQYQLNPNYLSRTVTDTGTLFECTGSSTNYFYLYPPSVTPSSWTDTIVYPTTSDYVWEFDVVEYTGTCTLQTRGDNASTHSKGFTAFTNNNNFHCKAYITKNITYFNIDNGNGLYVSPVSNDLGTLFTCRLGLGDATSNVKIKNVKIYPTQFKLEDNGVIGDCVDLLLIPSTVTVTRASNGTRIQRNGGTATSSYFGLIQQTGNGWIVEIDILENVKCTLQSVAYKNDTTSYSQYTFNDSDPHHYKQEITTNSIKHYVDGELVKTDSFEDGIDSFRFGFGFGNNVVIDTKYKNFKMHPME